MTNSAQQVSAEERADDRNRAAGEIRARIARLQRRSQAGAWAASLFLLISTWAWWRFPPLPSPEALTALLGAPPSPPMISIAFLTYTFFAIILSLARMMTGARHVGIFSHAGYLAGFYFFYHASGAPEESYWAVFAAGFTILGVEWYRIRLLCRELITRERERLACLEQTGRLPPEEP